MLEEGWESHCFCRTSGMPSLRNLEATAIGVCQLAPWADELADDVVHGSPPPRHTFCTQKHKKRERKTFMEVNTRTVLPRLVGAHTTA